MSYKAKPFESTLKASAFAALFAAWSVSLLGIFVLMGCSGIQSTVRAPLSAPEWRQATGGSYVAACRQGDTVTAVSHFILERWTLQDARPPSLTHRAVGSPSSQAPFSATACPSEAVAQSITRERPFSTPMEKKRRFVVSSSGRAVVHNDRYLDWRTVPSGLEGVTFDGASLWMVGQHSLWHFNVKSQTLSPKALPGHIGARSPVAVFRDGAALWIRTRDGHGWPVVVRGNYVHPLSAGGPLPPALTETRVPVGQHTVHWAGPGTQLRAERAGGASQTIDGVDALLPISDRYLLVGSGTSVTFWDLASVPIKSVRAWDFGGTTIAFFLSDDVLYAVGRDYGVITGALRRSSVPN